MGFCGMLQAPSRSSDPAGTRLLLGPYSRLGLQAVHQGHKVVGDQPLLARGERLRLPPLPLPARTQRGETTPRAAARTQHRAPGAAGVLGHPWNSLTLPGRGASPPSAAPGPRRAWARSCTGPPPACLGGQAEGRGGSGRFGGCHSHPTPRPGLTLHGGARRRRGLVGHQGVLNLGAVADQPLPGDRSPVSLSLCGIWPPRGHLWRCLAAGIGVCQPLLTWRLPSGSMG